MRVLISIISLRMESGIERCIESIRAAGGEFDLRLISNGDDRVAAYFNSLKAIGVAKYVVINPTNEGFQIPHDSSFQLARMAGYQTLVLSNDDTILPKGWLDRIEEAFRRVPATALVGASHTCRSVHDNLHGYEGDELEYIDGACLAIDVPSVWKHFHFLFPSYLSFIYGEDLDLSLRMRRLGYRIAQAGFSVQHARQSTCKGIPKTKESQERNHAVMRRVWEHYLKFRTFTHRIIVRRWFSGGDVLLTTPILRALYEQFPLCTIEVETSHPDVLAGNPCIRAAARDIMRVPGDLVINLDMASENSPLRHFITSYARAANVEDPPHATEIYWRADEEPDYKFPSRTIAIHADETTWQGKNWPEERWRELLNQLREDKWCVLLVGRTEAPRRLPHDVDWRNRTSIGQMAAAMARCKAFCGHDSLPMHVAGAVGIPTVGIFGITESKYILSGRGRQIGVDADPLQAPRAGERHRVSGSTFIQEDGTAIRTITVRQVMDAIKTVIA